MDLWVQTRERGHWNAYFSRPLNDWEVDNVEFYFQDCKERWLIVWGKTRWCR